MPDTLRTHSPTSAQSEPLGGKRRRDFDEQVSRKRSKEEFGSGPEQASNRPKNGSAEEDPVQYWSRTGEWPQDFAQMSGFKSDISNKRSRSSTSYSSRVRDGIAPPVHLPTYEDDLKRHGIRFDNFISDMVNADSATMCQALLHVSVVDLPPAYNFCCQQTFLKLLQRAGRYNEERIRRDITPRIVPSAELLYVLDGETTLEHIREEMSVDWTKCSLLGGTRPRPDYAYGLSCAAFTEEELSKLENYTTIDNPTKFTESMYFPFLLCEAKCGSKNVYDAERQNIHSASIAVNAIVQICRAADDQTAQSLSGHVLVFSVAHDNERVKTHGHFPIIRDGRTTFHRQFIHEFSLGWDYGRDRNVGSNFIRAVYRDFYPLHLQRIRQAIARLPGPRAASTVCDVNFGESETPVVGQFPQREDSSLGPPPRRAESQGSSQSEITMIKQHLAKIEQGCSGQPEQQKEETRKEIEELRELIKHVEELRKQIEQQKEERRKQKEEHCKQMAQQKEEHCKQMKQLEEALLTADGSRGRTVESGE